MTTSELIRHAQSLYPTLLKGRNPTVDDVITAYIKGYTDAVTEPDTKNFFVKAAEGLRNLWPSGEKDGKYPWRDTTDNLARRLEFIWREFKYKDKYSVDDILRAGRRYLSQFQDNTKYMQTLKYFIFKTEDTRGRDGKNVRTYKSMLCNLLESQESFAYQEEFASLEENEINTNSFEGELV